MANNQDPKDLNGNDDEFARAKKSMGDRVDPDPNPEPKPDPKPEPKPDPDPAPEPKPEIKKDIAPDDNPDGRDDAGEKKTVKRPEAFIPMKKWHDREHEFETREADLKKQIADLKIIAEQGGSQAKKDEDIEAYMQKTGFDRETVDGLLALAEKRVLTPELKEAITKAQKIVAEAEIDTAFSSEFQKDGEPALKTHFPDISAEQLEKAKTFLDKVAHTKEFHDKKLDYVVYENREEIKKLLDGDGGDPTPEPQTKKTVEANKPGGGKPVGLTAKDFAGDTPDFSLLNDMDPAQRSRLISSFPDKTYQKFVQYAGSQDGGLEVMRNGGKVKLK